MCLLTEKVTTRWLTQWQYDRRLSNQRREYEIHHLAFSMYHGRSDVCPKAELLMFG